jgi:hypothetical protein
MPVNTNTRKRTRIDRAKELKKQQENAAFRNVLLVFTAAVLLEIGLIIGYRQLLMNNEYLLWYKQTLSFGRYLFPSLTVIFAVAAVAAKIKRWNVGLYIKAALVCLACSFINYLAFQGAEATLKTLCIIVPVASLLLFVFFIYQREFFIESLICTLAIFAMLNIRSFYILRQESYIISYITIGLALISVVIAFIASRNRGRLSFFGRSLAVFDGKTAVYATIYIAAALSGLACIGGLVFGRDFAYIAVCILAAFLFIDAVFHTVKLM